MVPIEPSAKASERVFAALKAKDDVVNVLQQNIDANVRILKGLRELAGASGAGRARSTTSRGSCGRAETPASTSRSSVRRSPVRRSRRGPTAPPNSTPPRTGRRARSSTIRRRT